MSNTTYDVRIWKTEQYKGKKKTTYYVRWKVGKQAFKVPFEKKALADSFRADLVSAAGRGEAFWIDTGRPVSTERSTEEISWYRFACEYVDMKWPKAAATYRRTIAEALTAVTPVMLREDRGRPGEKLIRSALTSWAFNPAKRKRTDMPQEISDTLRWIERNSLPVSRAKNPETARALHEAAVTRLDGRPGARSVARQRRMILSNALNYAIERKLLQANPVQDIKWTAPKPSRAVDRRRVPNPTQARALLAAVSNAQHSGPRLAACYACVYFAALRPEEAVDLREHHATLPAPTWSDELEQWEYEWGELYVAEATPHAGSAWTDSGQPRDRKALKHRERGDGRPVPCPPELTKTLREHIQRYGVDAEGRLFQGRQGGEVPSITWNRVWKAARTNAFTDQQATTSLAGRPYDLRHAAVSTWLNGGVAPTKVAEWAGHSVEVLLEVYAKCLDGQDDLAKRQVQAALESS